MAGGPGKQRLFAIVAIAALLVLVGAVVIIATSSSDYEATFPAENEVETDISALLTGFVVGAGTRQRDGNVTLG